MRKYLFGWINEIPGLMLVDRRALVAFVCFVLACFCYANMQIGYLVLPPLLVNKTSIILVVLSFMAGFMFFLRSNLSNNRRNNKIWFFWLLTIGFVGWCTINGLIHNRYDHRTNLEVLSQACFTIGLFYVIMIGKGGIALSKMTPLFLTMFYISVCIMFMCKGINISHYNEFGHEMGLDELRNTTSMSYYFRPALTCAPFFVLLGLFWQKKMPVVVRVLCIGTILPYVYFTIHLFKFRTAVGIVALTLVFAAYYSLKTLRFKNALLIGAIVFVGIMFLASSASVETVERMQLASEEHREGSGFYGLLKGERGAEATEMFRQLTIGEILFGRGFNAAFDATDVMGNRAYRWKSIHLGFASNILRGGVFFAIVYFLVFLIACFRRLKPYEQQDGFMIACKGFAIVETVHYFCNPMQVGIYYFGSVMILYLCLGALWSEHYEGNLFYQNRR